MTTSDAGGSAMDQQTRDELAMDLLGSFPVADDRCLYSNGSGRQCQAAAWHAPGEHQFGRVADGGRQ